MYLENTSILQIIRTTELSEINLSQTAKYFIYFLKDAEKIASTFLEEIKAADSKTELVIIFTISEMIKYSMAESNVFILAFGKNLLEMTNHIIRKGDKNTILNLIQLFEFWNHLGIYNQNLSERCLGILNKKLEQIQTSNTRQNVKTTELDKSQEYERLQKNIGLVVSMKETKKVFDLRKEHSKIKKKVMKLKKKLEFITSSNMGQTQKEIQLNEILPKFETEKKNYISLFLNANKLLREFLN